MDANPWLVENIQTFSFLNCPECTFKSKDEDFFQEHAVKSHPMSSVLFDEKLFQIKEEASDEEKENDENTEESDVKIESDPIDDKVKKKKFPCYYCGKNFPKLKLLQKHRLEHVVGLGKFPCKHCPVKAPSYKEITKHMAKNHWESVKNKKGLKKWTCYFCDKNFTKSISLKEHHKSHLDENGKFLCRHCDKKFSSYKNMKTHMRGDHSNSGFECMECDKKFGSEYTYKKHKESVHVDKSVKQFICDQCPFATHAQLYLNVHKRKDHVNKRQKEFLCDNCPKEFDLKGLLQHHVCGGNDEETKFKCPKCDLVHSQRFFMNHYKKHHGGFPPGFEDLKKYPCELCPDQVFLWPKGLAQHKQAQHPNDGLPEEFICDRCDTGLDYKTERALLKHYFKDHGTLPSLLENTKKYICSQCPNIYTKKTSFDAHMRSKHSNAPRRYIKSQYQAQCPYCEKQFVTNVALTNHIILKHENSAQFQCDICHGKYPSENKLRVHIDNVHVKVTCDICGENFTRNELKKHRATMHGIGNAPADRADKPFKCPFCSMSFKSKRGLQKHSEIKHDTEIEVEVENDIEMGTEVQTMEFIIAS